MTRAVPRGLRRRALAPSYRHIGRDDDGSDIVTLRKHLRALVRAERIRNTVRNPTPADLSAVAKAEAKRDRKRARNLEAKR